MLVQDTQIIQYDTSRYVKQFNVREITCRQQLFPFSNRGLSARSRYSYTTVATSSGCRKVTNFSENISVVLVLIVNT